ncbi:MAG TPA: glycosyltransferase family 2 protein [Solirubrobacteraceae bacterium]|jgi:rhamnosyltransferase|nr:glycosyltransferase family 2 protein [Solirubrobacteraceae bacterium]
MSVTVAIPVRNGGDLFAQVLRAIAGQTVDHELLICDSGSTDGSADLAREHGARVIEIAPGQFNHGRTRNLLMREAGGSHVALLTQDAEPADERWLQRLLAGFEICPEVTLVYGPYIPRASASVGVRIELEQWFRSLSLDGAPRIDRLAADERSIPATGLLGERGFFTDANACIARSAWERVPFRDASYAEDRALAIDMLRQGYAKVYLPDAAVLHSHRYSASEQLRRCFDEWRGLHEIYGWREPADPRYLLGQLRGHLGRAHRAMLVDRMPARARYVNLALIAEHHVLRLAGAVLGSRADLLPPGFRRRLSLERRAD